MSAITVELLQEISRLTLENRQLKICPSFGIYTRQALELSWGSQNWENLAVIFCDLDDLKQLNSQLDYESVNQKIKQALSLARNYEILAYRYFSGDEFVFLAPIKEAKKAAYRLQQAFNGQELSGTFAVVPCLSPSLVENVCNAQFLVQWNKGLGRKGSIASTLSY